MVGWYPFGESRVAAPPSRVGGADRYHPGMTSGEPPSPRPKYERLREALAAQIAERRPHDPLPTERELALTHRLSRNTVRHALDQLAEAGTVYRVQGAGTFVADPALSRTLSLTSFTED